MKEFRQDNTDGYTDKQLDTLNAEWEHRTEDLSLEPGTDEYDFQSKTFADEVSRRDPARTCEWCDTDLTGRKYRETHTRSGHDFCSYACFDDFFGGDIPKKDDFLDIPK